MTNCDKEPENPSKILPDWKQVFVSREEFLKLLSLALSGMIGLIAAHPRFGLCLELLVCAEASRMDQRRLSR